MNANIISNAAVLNINSADVRNFEWNGSQYIGPDGLVLWIGLSTGGWGNGPSRYSIKVGATRPDTEILREAGPRAHRNEVDVTRSFRPLRPADVEDQLVWNAACRAVTKHFHHLVEERLRKERRQIEDLLRKDRRFFEEVKAVYLRRTSAEDEY